MRRTKEEAEQTRRRIIAAALRVFARDGIARTNLTDVARAAGVTRGAVYWHFDGKRDLFRAVRDAVSVPLLDRVDLTLLHTHGDDPLQRIERYLLGLLEEIEHNRTLRSTFEVMSFKCEYVGDFASERDALSLNTERVQRALERAYRDAAETGLLRPDLDPQVAAFESVAFATGLCRLVLLDSARFGESDRARAAIGAHVASRHKAGTAGPQAATISLYRPDDKPARSERREWASSSRRKSMTR